MTFGSRITEEARLIILKALASEKISETLTSSFLQDELKTYGITRSREWLHGEIDFLAEVGAVVSQGAGTVRVVTLTEKGNRHLDRTLIIEGVKRPSRAEA